MKEIGDLAVSQHRKFHPHHLRHSFAIHCIKRGMSIERLQKIPRASVSNYYFGISPVSSG
jgi:site-specific recombinase XerD